MNANSMLGSLKLIGSSRSIASKLMRVVVLFWLATVIYGIMFVQTTSGYVNAYGDVDCNWVMPLPFVC
jgi:hypothetical protein